jgi:large subunit ribosomal protein L3e
MHKREVVEAVTVIETPPLQVVGVVGYVETPRGLRSLTTVWAEHLSDEVKRRFYKNWYRSKKKAFTKYAKRHAESQGKSAERELERIRKYCTVVRVLAHTLNSRTGLKQKKAHLMEIQVSAVGTSRPFASLVANRHHSSRSTVAPSRTKSTLPRLTLRRPSMSRASLSKTRTSTSSVSQRVRVSRVSPTDGAPRSSPARHTRVCARLHASERGILPRCTWPKSPPSLVCVKSLTPAVFSMFSVARAGQDGYHHRTEINKKVYRIGKADDESNASTDFDATKKTITPLGGFVRHRSLPLSVADHADRPVCAASLRYCQE